MSDKQLADLCAKFPAAQVRLEYVAKMGWLLLGSEGESADDLLFLTPAGFHEYLPRAVMGIPGEE